MESKYYLHGEHGHSFWCINIIPYTETVSILGYHHVTPWNPLHIGTVAKDGGLYSIVNVIEMQLGITGEVGGRKETQHQQRHVFHVIVLVPSI